MQGDEAVLSYLRSVHWGCLSRSAPLPGPSPRGQVHNLWLCQVYLIPKIHLIVLMNEKINRILLEKTHPPAPQIQF
jgi:hypothetical protein